MSPTPLAVLHPLSCPPPQILLLFAEKSNQSYIYVRYNRIGTTFTIAKGFIRAISLFELNLIFSTVFSFSFMNSSRDHFLGLHSCEISPISSFGLSPKRIEYILEWNLLKKSVKRPFCCTVSILQVYFTYLCYITCWALDYHFIENLKLLLKENQIME